jgi:hypothetical protein
MSQKGPIMSIGLASENKLPKAYSATTHHDGKKVSISSEGRSATIDTNSFASVANILSAFSPSGETSLAPGATLVLKDEFSGRSISIVASAIIDVATVLKLFVVGEGKYLPEYEGEGETVGSAPMQENALETSDADPVEEEVDEEPAVIHTPDQAKSELLQVSTLVVEQQDMPAAAPAKKRGRPKKVVSSVPANEETTTEEGNQETTDHTSVIQPQASMPVEPVKKRGRPKKVIEATPEMVAAIASKHEKPGVISEGPSRKRGRPPKNTSPADVNQPSGRMTLVKTPSLLRPVGLLGPALVADHESKVIKSEALPAHMKGLDAFYVVEETGFRLDFTPLEIDPTKRTNVLGVPVSVNAASAFGFEIKTNTNEHAGWIIAEAEDKYVMTGLPELKISNHKKIGGAITRIIFAVASKVNDIHTRAA